MVIELGEASVLPETTSSPRTTGRRSAAFVAAALAVFAVLTLGGSAAATPRVRAVLVTDEMPEAFALSSSALFTSGFASGRPVARRYSLTDGSVQWSTDLSQPVDDVDLVEAARVLVVTSAQDAQISFLDADTGAMLWRRASGPTTMLRLSADSALMTSATPVGGTVLLQRVDLRTGVTLWSRRLNAGGYVNAGGDVAGQPDGIVTVDWRGRGAVINFADGAVRTTANLGAMPNDDTAHSVTYGDRFYLTHRQGGTASLTAYRLSDLRPLWRDTAAPWGRLADCGAYVCVSADAGMTVLDAGTGKARWSSTRWRLESEAQPLRISGPPRLVVTETGAGHSLRRALLDPATGQLRSALGHGQQVGALLLRFDAKRIGRTWIQVADARDQMRTVGSLDGMLLERCATAGSHLACADRHGRANVWHLTDP